jgi:hypothetical protein
MTARTPIRVWLPALSAAAAAVATTPVTANSRKGSHR